MKKTVALLVLAAVVAPLALYCLLALVASVSDVTITLGFK